MTNEKLEKIQRLIAVTGLKGAFWDSCSNVQKNAATNKELSCLSDEQTSAVLAKTFVDLMAGAIAVCEFNFSEQEIDELLELYNHPLVQRFLHLTPELHRAARDINRHGVFSPTVPFVPNLHPNTVH